MMELNIFLKQGDGSREWGDGEKKADSENTDS